MAQVVASKFGPDGLEYLKFTQLNGVNCVLTEEELKPINARLREVRWENRTHNMSATDYAFLMGVLAAHSVFLE